MNITNIEIRDFRNISNVSASFGPINIITGYNSTGKTNFLLALYHSLSTVKNYSDIFNDNIVTYQKGKDKATISVMIGDIKGRNAYIEAKKATFIAPEKFIFKKVLEKRSSSAKLMELYFTGNFAQLDDDVDTDTGNLTTLFKQLEDKSSKLKNELVFRESISASVQDENNSLIDRGEKKLNHQEKYIEIFSKYFDKIKAWIDDSNISSNLIYQFVVKRPTAEEYEQIVEYLKEPAINKVQKLSFNKAKFIYLLADIQKNARIREEFKKDISLYTHGIVNDINVNLEGKFGNKGDIMVNSPQGPKDLFTISTGTAVMLYFIVLKNWLNLGLMEMKYDKPEVMIFDELETNLHPNLLPDLYELLRSISVKTQLFIATHSPSFIDFFEKKEIFLMKDLPSLPGGNKKMNRCNMYDYESIIKKLPSEKQELYLNKSNSELFINGILDLIFPKND